MSRKTGAIPNSPSPISGSANTSSHERRPCVGALTLMVGAAGPAPRCARRSRALTVPAWLHLPCMLLGTSHHEMQPCQQKAPPGTAKRDQDWSISRPPRQAGLPIKPCGTGCLCQRTCIYVCIGSTAIPTRRRQIPTRDSSLAPQLRLLTLQPQLRLGCLLDYHLKSDRLAPCLVFGSALGFDLDLDGIGTLLGFLRDGQLSVLLVDLELLGYLLL